MENNYSKAYKEVVEVLKYVPKESVNKIPKIMLDTFSAKMDNDYIFSIDITKNFEEQELLEETKAILANIFRDYWATPYQKERIQAKEKYDRKLIEDEKHEKYNVDIFNNKRNNCTDDKEESICDDKLPIEIKKEKNYIFNKLIKFLKKILKTN